MASGQSGFIECLGNGKRRGLRRFLWGHFYCNTRRIQALTVFTAIWLMTFSRLAGLSTCSMSSVVICAGASSLTQPQILFSHCCLFSAPISAEASCHSCRALSWLWHCWSICALMSSLAMAFWLRPLPLVQPPMSATARKVRVLGMVFSLFLGLFTYA